MQVFTLPPDGSSVKNGNRVLCLTHEGVVERFHPSNVEVLNPLVDPVTGVTHLSLLDYTSRSSQVTRVDLALPKPCVDSVLPMAAIEIRHYSFFPNGGKPTWPYGTEIYSSGQYVDVSEEGEVRGFRRRSETFNSDHIMKFTIDTRQEEWVVDCGKFLLAKWSHLGDTWLNRNITFDGMRGKICFSDPLCRSSVVVVDIE